MVPYYFSDIMLALPQRRQHLPQTHSSSALPSPISPQQLSFDLLSQQLSAQQLYDQKLLNDYIQSQRSFAGSATAVEEVPNSFMTTAYEFNPAIRIQQSTPTPQLPAAYPPSMNATGAPINNNWNAFQNMSGNTQSLQTPAQSRTGKTHQRASSSSSVGSAGSQYQSVGPSASYPYVALSENLPSSSALLDSSNKADSIF